MKSALVGLAVLAGPVFPMLADREFYLTEVPDYTWYAGCYGTASGNLMGYWDRHGMSDFYTGSAGGGVAPLNDAGANINIRSMIASRAGYYGRPANQPGHIDDYWGYYTTDSSFSYESTATDPYLTAGRQEHTPDCLADFMGLSQKRWTNMNSECDGNIDAFSFNYWDTNGFRRTNFTPSTAAGIPARDVQSGLREWTKYRGYDADVFSQLTDFNPKVPVGRGFTFADMKAEIDAGYPVLLFLQSYNELNRSIGSMPRANPEIHGMLAYGYAEYPLSGIKWVYYRTSWGSGDGIYSQWDSGWWQAGMPVRGVIGVHPKPKIRSFTRSGANLAFAWDGPSSQLYDYIAGTVTTVHRYQLERAPTVNAAVWEAVGQPTTNRTATVTDCCGGSAYFYRVRLLGP